MPKKKGKGSVLKKLLIVALVLIVVQVVFIFVYSSNEKPVSIREAISKAVEKVPNISDKRREQARIQLAIADYMGEHQGTPPPNLDVLVPKYFDTIPLNPDTGKLFEYRVTGNTYMLGADTEELNAGVAKDKGKSGGKVSPGDGTAPITEEQQSILIASLSDPQAEDDYIYDPTGKRDPFEPFDFAPKLDQEGKTELERYDIGQLKLTAVLEGFDEPAAIVENNVGRGFTVKKGTKIGTNSGEIVDIKKDRLVIVETSVDFTGEKKSRTIEMKLRTKDQDSK